jgi:adenylosuccinate lyase
MRVDHDRLKANLTMSRGVIAAEPLYVLLAKYGHPDAHEAVRKLTLEADRSGRTVLEVAAQDAALRGYLKKLTPAERRTLERPEEYIGLAPEVARSVTALWRERLKGVLPE